MTIPAVEGQLTEPAIEAAPAPAEPTTEVQQTENTSYPNRDELGRFVAKVSEDYDATKVLQEIAAKDEITLADLKMLPEAKGLSDAQLQALWNEVAGTGNKAVETPKPSAPRAWKVYQGDKELSDYSKLTVEEFLKAQFSYNANNKEHRKTWDEVIRNAQQGHYNAERMTTLQKERQHAYDQWKLLEPKVQQYENERKIWENALAAAARNDLRPMESLLAAYMDALGNPAPEALSGPQIDLAQVQAGYEVYHSTVLPEAEKIAKEHGLTTKEVADGIMLLVENEPAEFLTPQRFQQIIQIEIPTLIQQMKAEAAPAPDTRDQEIAELKRQLEAAQKGTATKDHNAQVEALHKRRKSAPPAAPTVPGNNSPDATGIEDGPSARRWLEKFKG